MKAWFYGSTWELRAFLQDGGPVRRCGDLQTYLEEGTHAEKVCMEWEVEQLPLSAQAIHVRALAVWESRRRYWNGWNYRREGWAEDAASSLRPDWASLTPEVKRQIAAHRCDARLKNLAALTLLEELGKPAVRNNQPRLPPSKKGLRSVPPKKLLKKLRGRT
jgi:hypothetical protein